MNVRSLIGLLVVLALGVLFWWGMQTKDQRSELPTALAGRQAPTFEMELLDAYTGKWGQKLNLGDYLGKKPIVLNFWASWCTVCYEEASVVEAAWRRWGKQVMFVGVDTQDERSKGNEFVARFGLTFPNVYDPRGKIGIDYGMYGVPETFAISAEGRVIKRHAGSVDAATLEAMIREVLP